GDMNADGSVQPVGGIDAKVRGANNRDCTHVAIPGKCTSFVYDTAIMEGFGPITEIQVFTIDKFDDAKALAQQEKSELINKSIASFDRIVGIYTKNPSTFSTTIRHPKVVTLLEEIVKDTPNHLSAKILLEYTKGQMQKTLSLHGSTEFIEQRAYSITQVIVDGKVSKIEGLTPNKVVESVNLLRRSKERLDQRTWKWSGELIKFATLLNQLQTNPPQSTTRHRKLVSEINAALREVNAERDQLFESPEAMEELLQ
ncbi:MAG: hypothetical protein AAF226_15245, partial [Verrucomicrobiota bacterium]